MDEQRNDSDLTLSTPSAVADKKRMLTERVKVVSESLQHEDPR